MSRQVDPNSSNLSKEDKLYLAARGQLPVSTMPVEEQRQLLDPDAPTLEQRANTGDVNTVNISKEEFEELQKLRAAAEKATDAKKLFGSTSGAGDDEDESDDEPLEAPYDQYTNAQLRAEIERRNEDREDDEKLALTGTKPELVERLDEDDAEDDE